MVSESASSDDEVSESASYDDEVKYRRQDRPVVRIVDKVEFLQIIK